MRKIGIYPGTFDPVHQGHLAFANEALELCKLDEVIFLPESLPRGKPNATHISKRVAHLNETLSSVEAMQVMHLGDEKFTIQDTLPKLNGLFGEAEQTLLVGSDVARTFLYRWDGLEVLLRQTSLAIGMRANDTSDEMMSIMRELEDTYKISITYKLIFTPHSNISSSHLKSLPDSVSQFIAF